MFYASRVPAMKQLGVLLALVAASIGPGSAQSPHQYTLQSGDVLEIRVVGIPALDRRATISDDGKLRVPLIGQVDAKDHSLAELQQTLESLLVQKNIVQRPSVGLNIVEHRPIYISGDISKAGEYRYRPGMTIRNAVALAGGYDLLGVEARGTPSQVIEGRGQVTVAAIELVRYMSRAQRIGAQLTGQEKLVPDTEIGRDLNPALVASIWANETRQLEADLNSETTSRAHLKRMLELAQEQSATFEASERQLEEALQQQEADVARSRELLQRSVGTISRAEETQRALTQVRIQLADAKARTTQARKELSEYTRNLEAYDEQRTSRLVSALQDAEIEAGKARSRLESERSRLELAELGGLKRSEISVTATIYRQVEGSTEKKDATLDTMLIPGDTVEIAAAKASTSGDARNVTSQSRSISSK